MHAVAEWEGREGREGWVGGPETWRNGREESGAGGRKERKKESS